MRKDRLTKQLGEFTCLKVFVSHLPFVSQVINLQSGNNNNSYFKKSDMTIKVRYPYKVLSTVIGT